MRERPHSSNVGSQPRLRERKLSDGVNAMGKSTRPKAHCLVASELMPIDLNCATMIESKCTPLARLALEAHAFGNLERRDNAALDLLAYQDYLSALRSREIKPNDPRRSATAGRLDIIR